MHIICVKKEALNAYKIELENLEEKRFATGSAFFKNINYSISEKSNE